MRQIWALIFCTLSIFIVGCNSANDNSKVKITFPKAKVSASGVSQSVSAMVDTDSGEDWNSNLNPVTISDVNCYGVFVGGPDSFLQRNFVHDEYENVALRFGPWIAAIPEGHSAEIDVPSGPKRKIVILGWKANLGACKIFDKDSSNDEPDFANLSYPFVVGSAELDLAPGDVNLEILISMTNAFAVHNFQGADFDHYDGETTPPPPPPPPGPTFDMYGDERDGDLELTASSNLNTFTYDLSATTLGASSATAKYFNRSVRVTGVSADGLTLTTSVLINNNFFEPDDEVIWHIFAGSDATSPDTNACGGIPRGVFGFAKVISTGANSVTLDHDLDPNANYSNLNVSLSNSPYEAGYNFCRMHITRVPNFRTLTISNGGTFNINVQEFLNGGGLVVFRTKNLVINGTTNIDVSGKGFKANSMAGGNGFGGQGTTDAGFTSDNGGAFYTSSGGGGGSAASPGGRGVDASALGGSDIQYCGGPCYIINGHKIVYGGAGGADSSYLGGNGGGAVFIHAENITGTASLSLKSKGIGNTSGASGGGAGGTIHLTSRSINIPVTSDASGGAGGPSGGGGGAGGVVEIPFCSAESTVVPSALVSGGAAGSSALAGGTGSVNILDETSLCSAP